MTRPALSKLAEDRGLAKWGTKAELTRRLSDQDAERAQGSADPVPRVLDCGCGPGQTCGAHLPIPPGWPDDLPLPDLEIPQPADLIELPTPPVIPLGSVERRGPSECFTSFRVSGRDAVEAGFLNDDLNVKLRGMAVDRAVGEGYRAVAPRLACWQPSTGGESGIATYAMIVKAKKVRYALGDPG